MTAQGSRRGVFLYIDSAIIMYTTSRGMAAPTPTPVESEFDTALGNFLRDLQECFSDANPVLESAIRAMDQQEYRFQSPRDMIAACNPLMAVREEVCPEIHAYITSKRSAIPQEPPGVFLYDLYVLGDIQSVIENHPQNAFFCDIALVGMWDTSVEGDPAFQVECRRAIASHLRKVVRTALLQYVREGDASVELHPMHFDPTVAESLLRSPLHRQLKMFCSSNAIRPMTQVFPNAFSALVGTMISSIRKEGAESPAGAVGMPPSNCYAAVELLRQWDDLLSVPGNMVRGAIETRNSTSLKTELDQHAIGTSQLCLRDAIENHDEESPIWGCLDNICMMVTIDRQAPETLKSIISDEAPVLQAMLHKGGSVDPMALMRISQRLTEECQPEDFDDLAITLKGFLKQANVESSLSGLPPDLLNLVMPQLKALR